MATRMTRRKSQSPTNPTKSRGATRRSGVDASEVQGQRGAHGKAPQDEEDINFLESI